MPDPPPDDDLEAEPGLDDGDASVPRPRRRLATPVTAGLAGLALVTAGFIGGVQVQKGQAGATTATPNLRPAGLGGAPGGGAAAGGGPDAPTVGTVANKNGTTLYVTGADGTTVRVKTNAQSKVTRNAAASPRGIFPGDTVVVQGTKDGGGLVATQITATSKAAAASGGGFPGGGFAQRFGGGGGAAPAGG